MTGHALRSLAAAVLAINAFVATAADLRFTALPMLDERTLRARFAPLLNDLGEAIGETVSWHYFPQYEQVLQALEDGEVDLAFLGPLPYVELTDVAPHFEPLVHVREPDGNSRYFCALAVFGPDQPALRDLTTRRFALTQPLSTCGSFAVSVMLQRAGLALNRDGNRYRFTGGHDTAALAVLAGRADVAGLKSNVAKRYESLGLTIIAEAGPYPGFAFVVNTRTVAERVRAAIRAALLELGEQARAQGQWPSAGMVGAADADYADFRADWHAVRTLIRGLD